MIGSNLFRNSNFPVTSYVPATRWRSFRDAKIRLVWQFWCVLFKWKCIQKRYGFGLFLTLKDLPFTTLEERGKKLFDTWKSCFAYDLVRRLVRSRPLIPSSCAHQRSHSNVTPCRRPIPTHNRRKSGSRNSHNIFLPLLKSLALRHPHTHLN